MLPQIAFEGSLTRDPLLMFTPSGVAKCKFDVAINDRKKDDNGNWVKGDTTFLQVIVWRQAAEHCAESLRKGDSVVVVGRFKVRNYETKEGEKRQQHEVEADSVGLSLRWESVPVSNNKRTAITTDDDSSWTSDAPF